jgi:membrane protein DedA with SNARE-associated domain
LAQAILALLTSAHGVPAYGLVFGVLVACGLGLPLPEDVSLVTGGYLSYVGAAQFAPMLLVAFAGILAGDFLIFTAGRRYGCDLAGSRWCSRFLPQARLCKAEQYFKLHGEGLVFAARFFPGLRAVTYFVAGASPMATWRFLLFDGLAACVSAPVWMVLGRKLGRHLPDLLLWVERVHLGLLVAAGILVATSLVALLRRARRDPYRVSSFERATPESLVDGAP